MKEILKRPVVSEKSMDLAQNGKYIFIVDNSTNKIEIKKAIEDKYNTEVDNVRIINVRGKTKRFGRIFGKRSDYKKAIVTLKKGKKIEVIKGV